MREHCDAVTVIAAVLDQRPRTFEADGRDTILFVGNLVTAIVRLARSGYRRFLNTRLRRPAAWHVRVNRRQRPARYRRVDRNVTLTACRNRNFGVSRAAGRGVKGRSGHCGCRHRSLGRWPGRPDDSR
jgi:hypothetical protein